MIIQSKRHLAAAGETYAGHFRFAATVGTMTMAAGLACVIHAVVPALCERTASRTVGLLSQLFERRELLAEVEARSLEAIAFVGLALMALLVSVMLAVSPTPFALKAIYSMLAFAMPLTLLLTNRDLDCPATV
jgi:hypothetical protein